MLPGALCLLCLAVLGVNAQDEGTSDTETRTSSAISSGGARSGDLSFTNSFVTLSGTQIPTTEFPGTDFVYLTQTGQRTVVTATQTVTTNGTIATITTTSSVDTRITVSSGGVQLTTFGALPNNSTTTTTNQTATSTTTSVRPTNTAPCNGFPEFCTRKYSNITMITAHNAAFVMKNNAASNQELPIKTQLIDGIRMLQGQVHWENNTFWNCHTSCELLNAGPWQDTLETVREWLAENRNEVLTLLIGNSENRPPSDFVVPITNAGLLPYVYEPAYVPQYRDQWPTLGEMILKNQRLVIFMDYGANQAEVPYIMDELTHMWATPFSPTDPAFPCTVQQPPDLNETAAREQYMYIANHNLNVAVDLSSLGITMDTEILIPNTADLNITNGQENQFGRLGSMSLNCTADWGRPPNFLVVDYYNRGSPEPGSVFHVAAAANNVTYTQKCCGLADSAASFLRASSAGLAVALFVSVILW